MSNEFRLSNEMRNFIKHKIGECKSKEGEEKIMNLEVEKLKIDIKKPKLEDKEIWIIGLKILYANMLGYDTSIFQTFFINLVQSKNFIIKKIAYLGCYILLEHDSGFRILIVSSLTKDINSSCIFTQTIALNALIKIISLETAEAFITLIRKKLSDKHPLIRKKCYQIMISINRLKPLNDYNNILIQGLKDNDLTVSLSMIGHICALIKNNIEEKEIFKKEIQEIIRLLNLIKISKLHKDYYYQERLAPWHTCKLLEILGILGKNDPSTSQIIFPILNSYLQTFTYCNSEMDVMILNSILIVTSQIFHNEELINMAVLKLDQIITTNLLKNSIRKYISLNLIQNFIHLNQELNKKYQLFLIECLDNDDESIKKLAIEILIKKVNKNNLDLVAKKVWDYLITSKENENKKEIIEKFYTMIETNAISSEWYIDNVFNLLRYGRDNITTEWMYKIFDILKEMKDYNDNNEFFKYLISNLYDKEEIKKNSYLTALIAFLISNNCEIYDNENDIEKIDEIVEYLGQLLKENFENDLFCKKYIITSLFKLKCIFPNKLEKINNILQNSYNVEDHQISSLMIEYSSYNNCDRYDTNNYDFLNTYVQKDLNKGGKIYQENKLIDLYNNNNETKIKTENIKNEDVKNKINTLKESEIIIKRPNKWSKTGYKKEEENKNVQSNIKITSYNNDIELGNTEKNVNKSIFKSLKFTLPFKKKTNPIKEESFNKMGFNNDHEDINKFKKEKPKEIIKLNNNDTNLNINNNKYLEQAMELFGDDNLQIKPNKGLNLFSTIKNKKEENIDQEIYDNKLVSWNIRQEDFEGIWDKYESQEETINFVKRVNFVEFKKYLRSLNGFIINIIDEEILMSAKINNQEILFYINYNSNGNHEMQIRGQPNGISTFKKYIIL